MRRGTPLQGHHNVHTEFVTIGHTVQNFKYYRQTHKDTEHSDIISLCFRMLAFPDSQSLCSLYYFTVCVCQLASSVEPADRLL